MGIDFERTAPDAVTPEHRRRRTVVQRSLRVDHAFSPDEREADRVADLALEALGDVPSTFGATLSGSRIQRREEDVPVIGHEGGQLDAGTDARIRQAPTGRALSDDVSREMGAAFGADFSGVRITANSPIAPSLGARAFTYGREIHFATGEYHPSSVAGRRVLAHELAHTIQQGASPTRIQRATATPPATAIPPASATPAARIRPVERPRVQALFKTMRTNLVQVSGNRKTNAAYTQILTLLSQGAKLQNETPSVANVPDLLALIPQIQNQIPTAQSTKLRGKGSRNAGLVALNTALGMEQAALTAMLTRLRTKRAADAATMNAGWAGPAGNIVATGGHNASGSYFDRDVGTNAIRGIFKPESQEGGAKSGTAVRGAGAVREVVGYEASQRLGLGVVPQTQLVAVTSAAFAGGAHPRVKESGEAVQVGSYQQGVQNRGGDVTDYLSDNTKAPQAFDADSLQKMAILDMLTLNADRHGENVMYRTDGTIAAIDQGEIAPDALRFGQKFQGLTAESGWAWADLPEAEQPWSVANRQIIENMDPEAEVDALATKAQTESSRMASVTGQQASDTNFTDAQVAMMKYGGRLLKMAARGGLTPAETETIYKGRGTDSRVATAKKTAKAAGGGEFAMFISSTFSQDQQDAMVAKATNQPVPPPKYAYRDPTTEELFLAAVVTGLTRVYSTRAHPPADIAAEIRLATGTRAVPRVISLIDTADPNTIPAVAPSPENAARNYVKVYLQHKAAGEWDEAYRMLLRIRQWATALEASQPLADTNKLAAEMVEVSAHLNLPDPTIGAALPPITVNSTSAQAGRLWAHVDPPVAALAQRHVDDKAALAALWDGGPQGVRQRLIDILDTDADRLKMSHTGYIMEAFDPLHRMTVTSVLGDWYNAGHPGQFLVWLHNHPPADTTNATYYGNAERDAARVKFTAGKLSQGVPAAPIDTGAGEGWIVVLSPDGKFYTQPKSPRAQANDKTQHSSFLGGIPVAAAAMWNITGGRLKKVNNYSGHYRPDLRHMVKFLLTLKSNGVNVSQIDVEDANGLGRLVGQVHFTGDDYLARARAQLRG